MCGSVGIRMSVGLKESGWLRDTGGLMERGREPGQLEMASPSIFSLPSNWA